MISFEELWEALITADEGVEIEAKRAEEVGRSVQETICAFANEPGRGGGHLVLGVDSEETLFAEQYFVTGVPDADKLQADIATQCREVFSVPIRPEMRTTQHDGKIVVVVFIREAAAHEKPVFIKARGLPGGALRRIGSTDQRCTDEDIQFLYQGRGHASFDSSAIPDADPVSDFDPDAIAEYRRVRAAVSPTASELRYSDPELLHALFATSPVKGAPPAVTLCGLLAFGSSAALRRHMPLTRIDYIRIPSRKWERDPSGKFHTVELRGPLLTLIPRVLATVLDDLPKAFTLSDDQIHRREVPALPQQVLREAIVNAVMHRSYKARGAIQIIRYSNRLEIRNPGHSLKPEDRLGEPGSLARNEKLAAILHETGLAETKGSGIRVMRDLMQTANLSAPIFESDREHDAFAATFLVHHFFTETDVKWLGGFIDCDLSEDDTRALLLVRELGAITNAVFRNMTRLETLAASVRLRRLRDLELLEQKGKGNQTFYVPGPRLAQAISAWRGELNEATTPIQRGEGTRPKLPLSEELRPLSEEASSSLKQLRDEVELLRTQLPQEIRDRIASFGRRIDPALLDSAILDLCRWKPLTLAQLAMLTGRQAEHIRQRSLRRLLNSNQLAYERPNLLTHPSQRYVGTVQITS